MGDRVKYYYHTLRMMIIISINIKMIDYNGKVQIRLKVTMILKNYNVKSIMINN
jgi:hypothetical protein